ncbi:MAG: TonB-dependent receptor [Pseudomonadota bacterium]
MRYWLLIMLAGGPLTAFAQQGAAEDQEADGEVKSLPEITIIGRRGDIQRVPGAATVIDGEGIVLFNQSDIQRMIRQVPGVSVQIEDGYGLRPNLSIRGTPTERSARITLLEDGIPIAPAPYAAPAAYYFPTTGRLARVEVLKGPAAITEGPYTVGGAVNLLSTAIPTEKGGLINLQAGEDATWRLHAHYGETSDAFGWLVETHQWQSDGFQALDTGADTGLEKEDYLVKLRYATDASAAVYNQFDLKLHYASENSDQSYLGLADVDFEADPLRRYGLSTLDNIDTKHSQVLLRHLLRRGRFEMRSSLYYNEFERDWFKTEAFDVTGSPNAESFNGLSWFQVVQAVNRGQAIGPASAEVLRGILNGDDTDDGAIQIRSNAREYYSTGIEIDLGWGISAGGAEHELSVGVRRHRDHEERLQRNSTYTQVDGLLVLDDLGLLGNAGNAEQDADAWAFWVRNDIDFGRWQLSPGIRYEIIDQERTRWETRPGETVNPASRAADNIRDQRSNDVEVVIPGVGFVYDFSTSWSAYGGVHKGFSAPSNAPRVDEEESWNYELGARFDNRRASLDVGFFLTDYDNLVGTCTASSGVDCEVGDAFNGDAATVAGLEVSVTREFLLGNNLTVPLRIAYTFIDAEFDSDIADTSFFGDVRAGDPLPYIPEHQAFVSLGVESVRWGIYASLNFVDDTCVRASCGPFERTESSSLIDLSASYVLGQRLTLTASVENLGDAADIVGRTPYGARPNKSRTTMLGIRFRL